MATATVLHTSDAVKKSEPVQWQSMLRSTCPSAAKPEPLKDRDILGALACVS